MSLHAIAEVVALAVAICELGKNALKSIAWCRRHLARRRIPARVARRAGGPMRIVSDQTDKDIARRHAQRTVDMHLRQLAANLLRVIRGTGQPEAIIAQVVALSTVLRGYHEKTGEWPSADSFAGLLDLRKGYLEDALKYPEQADELIARSRVIRAALQVAASELLNQRTQITTAEHDL